MDSPEHPRAGAEQVAQSKGVVLGVLVAATAFVNLPLYLPLWPQLGDWLYPGMFVAFGLMATLPFLLARVIPGTASFDKQWFPHPWWQWLWFVGMVVLVFVCGMISNPLANMLPLNHTPPLSRSGFVPSSTIRAVILHGIVIILLAPIAEELFWRGYLLEQLRKTTHSGIALLIQSLLFSVVHLPLVVPRMGGLQTAIAAFLYGMVFGIWRIQFRSLLPLILAHILLNAVGGIPLLIAEYDNARLVADMGLPDLGAKIRASPECQQIYSLTREPTEKAVPAIIGFLASPDDIASYCAADTLLRRYRNDVTPYLRDALASGDKKTINGVLTVIDMGQLSDMRTDVRKVVWSVDDPLCQGTAIVTLSAFRDVEELRHIAKDHPKEAVRKMAEWRLASMEEGK
jgi:membrane protease YdiL (CAAX protease family)